MSQTATRKFQILSLSGGGYRGLHIARILELIESKIGGGIAQHFDLIAGTSIGGIIGLALALDIPAAKIRQTLEDIGPKLFPGAPPSFPFLRALFEEKSTGSKLFYACKHKGDLENDLARTQSAWYDPAPLANALISPEFFDSKKMTDLLHPIIIPTVNYSNGEPRFYKTDHHNTFTFDRDISIIDVALGTSAAPIYFPVKKINDQRIVDGGLIANDPTMVAVHEAMAFFGVRPELFGDASTGKDDLQVLSIGTLSPKHFADTSRPLNQGMLDWGTGVFDLAGSAQEAMAAYMVDKHMLKGKVIRLPSLDARPEKASGMADVSNEAKEKLRASAENLTQTAFGSAQFTALFKHKGLSLADVRAQLNKGGGHA